MSKQKVMANAEKQMLTLEHAWQQCLQFEVNMKEIIFIIKQKKDWLYRLIHKIN